VNHLTDAKAQGELRRFMRQIEKADFGKESDVKLLYKKAKEIESQIVNVDYDGNAANMNRLFEVTEKLNAGKMPEIRVIKLPKCKVAISGEPDPEWSNIENFSRWWGEYDKKRHSPQLAYSSIDFLYAERGGLVWCILVEDDAASEDCGGYDVVDFEGGLYAVHTSIDGDMESQGLVIKKIMQWIETTGFELDQSRSGRHHMGHMINPSPEIKKGLGYHQYEMFIPIRLKEEKYI